MSKILITYFSASEGRVTEALAKKFKSVLDADLFEIKPVQPYTKADINWVNPFSRCNKEKMGKKDVPVVGKVENFENYDLVLIGFPVWYAAAPNVINTFVKGYDFSGKKIALFATSGGGGIGKSAEKLKPYLSETANIVGAKLFKNSVTENELKSWIERL